MATERKYLSLEKLGLYDTKIKALINTKDGETLASAKAYADSLATNYDAAGSASTVQGNLDAEIARAKAKEDELAASIASTQGEVDALETYVGTIPTIEGEETPADVIAYINKKTEGIATDGALAELQTQVTINKNDITTIKGDYLKASDKTELANAISDEEARATGAESALSTRIKTIEDDYLKTADKTALQNTIDANKQILDAVKEDVDTFFADADMTAQAKDTLKEIQDYINSDVSAAAEMAASIKQNSDAITALDTKVGTIPEGAVSTNVVAYVDEKVGAEKTRAEGVESGLDTRISAIETKFGSGDGSVADMIADAKAEAISEATSTAAADATTKADKALSDAKTYANGLNTAMDTRVKAVEATSHTHSNKALLDTYTQTEANLADAVAKKHEHANATVLDGIKASDVTTWNTVTSKASQTDLEAEITRATAAEQANAEAIAAFVEISEAEINALFA